MPQKFPVNKSLVEDALKFSNIVVLQFDILKFHRCLSIHDGIGIARKQ